ncbi:MAG: radical SAM protein [Spirochaetes bacterium]|nr:radical SAM protein [Spirochaetota bacterium]
MKLLLINTNTIKPLIAPIGLEYVGEYIEVNSNGVEVSILDLSFDNRLQETIKQVKPDFIGVTVRNTDDCSYPTAKLFLPEIKGLLDQIKETSDAPVILGGAGFSVMPEAVLNFLDMDYGIHGDGEDALLQFIEHYPDIRSIPNLVYRENNEYKKTRMEFFDLKKLDPERKMFDNEMYFKQGGMGSFETKRGCPNECIYCVDPLSKGSTLRLRDDTGVVAEIERLFKQGIDHFHICDSEFNIPYHHAENICKTIIRKGFHKKIRWYCYCSAEGFDFSLAKLMKEAGCAGINFGVDSGSDAILSTLKRGYSSNDLIRLGKDLKKAGLIFMFDLLLGGPNETEDTIRETIKLMEEVKPDVVGTAIGVRVYKGTVLERMIRNEDVGNKALYGEIKDNENLVKPVFYISPKIGKRIIPLVEDLTRNNKRFLFSYGKDKKDYNYNENDILTQAIKKGARGAFWDILRGL